MKITKKYVFTPFYISNVYKKIEYNLNLNYKTKYNNIKNDIKTIRTNNSRFKK